MNLSVSDAYGEIQQELNLIGQQVDQTDVFLYMKRAVNYFSTSYAFPTAKKKFSSIFFNGVREIGVPSDFGTLIEPQRPSGLTSPRFTNRTAREIVHWPFGRNIGVEYDGETPFLYVEDDEDSSAFLLAGCEDTAGVTIAGDSSTIAADNIIYTQGLGSLRFTITASGGQTIISFSSLGPVDITDYLTKNWIFLDLVLPDSNTSALTGITLQIGNDASNYHQMTATTCYRGNTIKNGIAQVGFDLTARTTTGTVTNTNITWMQVVLNYGLTGVNGVYRLDNIFTAQGIFFEVPYYSRYNILAGGVTPADTITQLTDEIMLPVQCNEAIIYKALELIAASPNVSNQAFANYAARELKPKEDLLSSLYPVQRILVQSTYYKKNNFKKRSSSIWK